MKSKVLDELINENNKLQDKDLIKMLELVKQSEYYTLFSEIMSNVKEEYFVDDSVHGITHNERVALYAFVIGLSEALSYNELKLTVLAAVYHDIGRKDAKGGEHGYRSAEILEENREFSLGKEECKMLQKLITIHMDIRDYEEKEVFLLGCKEMFLYLKDVGLIKEK